MKIATNSKTDNTTPTTPAARHALRVPLCTADGTPVQGAALYRHVRVLGRFVLQFDVDSDGVILVPDAAVIEVREAVARVGLTFLEAGEAAGEEVYDSQD